MKKIFLALTIGFFCTVIISSGFEKTQTALAGSVLRLHVIANSDSSDDQALKLKVRDCIIEKTEHLFDSNGNIDAARETVWENLDVIKECAEEEIRKNGFDYDVNVSLGMSDFPTKEYGSLVLPAGTYEALKVEIGSAKGKNWWCVLFPPLCFVDETCVTVDSESFDRIEESLDGEASEFVKKEKSDSVKIKFKAYEIWQNGKQKIAYLFGRTRKAI